MGSLFSSLLRYCTTRPRLLRAGHSTPPHEDSESQGESEDSETEDEDEATGATPTPKRRALLVGISYLFTQSKIWTPLEGPHEDVERFRKLLLETYKYSPEDITVLKDDPSLPDLSQPTRANMIRELRRLVSGAGPGDKFVFLYSGHSDQQPSYDEPEVEEDGQDEVIITCDEQRIIDNELKHILVDGLPDDCFLVAIFDTCHSGTMLDLPHYYCNAVYVPWISRGDRRTKTLQNRIGRNLAFGFFGLPALPSRRHTSIANVLDSRRHNGTPSGSQFRANTEIASSVSRNQREMSVEADPHQARGRSAYRPIASPSPQQRYDSPDCRVCDGWCDYNSEPHATVLSLSACADLQRAWEGPRGSLTAVLCDFLKINPLPSYQALMSHVNFQVHTNCRALHEYTRYEKKKAARGEGPGFDGELNNFQAPQLSSLARLDMDDMLLL
ncbi:caspase domain-containing protein [Russula brevipes]|nr:caspase domain-containing protein [Russula brevipes]